jgi:hypothetical protein
MHNNGFLELTQMNQHLFIISPFQSVNHVQASLNCTTDYSAVRENQQGNRKDRSDKLVIIIKQNSFNKGIDNNDYQ